jgi:predicted NBD/HSP70 family sugar kinase
MFPGAARQRSLRQHNLGLALRLVADSPEPLSRARVAEGTGLTRATASTLVEELLAGGLLEEVPLAPTARSGRPATGIALAAGVLVGLGLEINVDYLAATVLDLRGDVVLEEVVEGDQRGRPPADVLRDVRGLATRAGKGLRVAGAALALPGLLRDGRLLVAPNLGWQDVDVARLLGKRLSATLDNEANFAALSQVRADRRSFVHLSGEIGIGAGIVVDGQLFRGTRGWSGEIGHVTVQPDGPLCHCGARGCLEVYAGQEALRTGSTERAAHALGTVLAGVLNVLDIGTVVLGGVYAELSSDLLPAIESELRARVLWAGIDPPTVVIGDHGSRAAALGAASSVTAGVLSSPDRWLVT